VRRVVTWLPRWLRLSSKPRAPGLAVEVLAGGEHQIARAPVLARSVSHAREQLGIAIPLTRPGEGSRERGRDGCIHCDDGNRIGGDGCSRTCRVEIVK